MDGRNRAIFRVGKQNRDAIGRLHGEQHASLTRDERIRMGRFFLRGCQRIHAVNDIGMKLAQGHDAHLPRAQGIGKLFAIRRHALSRASQSVKPRFSAFALLLLLSPETRSSLTPPGRVLNPCTSHLWRSNAGACRSCTEPTRRSAQFFARRGRCRLGAAFAVAEFFLVVVGILAFDSFSRCSITAGIQL